MSNQNSKKEVKKLERNIPKDLTVKDMVFDVANISLLTSKQVEILTERVDSLTQLLNQFLDDKDSKASV